MKRTDAGVPAGKTAAVVTGALPALLFALLLFPAAARATWSITAVDETTGEVGAAGASCALDVWKVAGLAPGRGAVVSQARSSGTGRERAVSMLMAGAGPGEVIRALTDPRFDRSLPLRQYGIAALGSNGGTSAFTGTGTAGAGTDVQGPGVSVQGNSLVSAEVVGATLAAFMGAAGEKELSLSDRLLVALEAGSRSGGDIRCGERRALSAFLVVARPVDDRRSPYVELKVRSSGGAVPLLRRQYEEWKKDMARVTATISDILKNPGLHREVVLAGVLTAKRFPGAIDFNDGTGTVEVHFDNLAEKDDIVLPGASGNRRRYLLHGKVGRFADGEVFVGFEHLEVLKEKEPPLPAVHAGS